MCIIIRVYLYPSTPASAAFVLFLRKQEFKYDEVMRHTRAVLSNQQTERHDIVVRPQFATRGYNGRSFISKASS